MSALPFSPLTDRGLMVKRALAEDEIAGNMRAAVGGKYDGDRDLFLGLAEEAAREANEYDAALVQRFGYSPCGITRDWGGLA